MKGQFGRSSQLLELDDVRVIIHPLVLWRKEHRMPVGWLATALHISARELNEWELQGIPNTRLTDVERVCNAPFREAQAQWTKECKGVDAHSWWKANSHRLYLYSRDRREELALLIAEANEQIVSVEEREAERTFADFYQYLHRDIHDDLEAWMIERIDSERERSATGAAALGTFGEQPNPNRGIGFSLRRD